MPFPYDYWCKFISIPSWSEVFISLNFPDENNFQAKPHVIFWEVRFILCMHAAASFSWNSKARIRNWGSPGKMFRILFSFLYLWNAWWWYALTNRSMVGPITKWWLYPQFLAGELILTYLLKKTNCYRLSFWRIYLQKTEF